MERKIEKVGVVGLGTMGAGIVEVFARNGVEVVAVEIDGAALERGRATLTRSTERAVARGKLDGADRDALLGRVTFAVGLDALAEVDLVVEAVPERLEIKRSVFGALDRICRPDAVLATNTSSLSVTEIAVTTGRPERVIGVHFFNPAPVMKLVEIIRTVVTAPEVVAAAQDLTRRLGKVGVTIADRAGFVANALLFGYVNQAVAMLESGFATRDDIDAAMTRGAGLPMGPFTLLDLIGLDVGLEVLDTMYRHGGRNRRHAAAPLLRQMVTAGLLGRKTGQGFYSYGDAVVPSAAGEEETRPVATVGVVGLGSVAEAFAGAGYDVVGPLDPAGPFDDLAGVDLVVAAGGRDLFERLDAVCKPGVVLAAATPSDQPVIDLAMATERPSDVVGLHFVGGEVVEVVTTIRTAPEAVATARAVVAGLGRTAVTVRDRAGFVVDALLFPYLNDAVKMLEAAYATADDIDHAMTLGCGYPSGPIAMLDAAGPATVLAVQRAIHRETGEPGDAPAPLLVQMVAAGRTFRP